MEVIDIRDNYEYMKEYVRCCYSEWSNKDMEILDYIDYKMKKINDEDNIISVLGLINDRELIGFISLFKYDGEEKRDLTPWYATMLLCMLKISIEGRDTLRYLMKQYKIQQDL